MTTTVRTIKDSQYGARSRTTNLPLAFCGMEKRPGGTMVFAMSSKSGKLVNEEPLIIESKIDRNRTLCKMGDGSETWIERKA